MNWLDWTNIGIGAILGALIGLGITQLFSSIQRCIKKCNFKKDFKQYYGKYSVDPKGKTTAKLEWVYISFNDTNMLNIKSKNSEYGYTKGQIVVDEDIKHFGKGFYYHTDKNHKEKSGIWEVLFVKSGIIHAKQVFIKAGSHEEIIHQYIWKKKMP